MGLFKKKTVAEPRYPAEDYEPVLRCSICTGEQVACMRDRHSGKLQEIMLIRSQADLDEFCRRFAVDPSRIKKVY